MVSLPPGCAYNIRNLRLSYTLIRKELGKMIARRSRIAIAHKCLDGPIIKKHFIVML